MAYVYIKSLTPVALSSFTINLRGFIIIIIGPGAHPASSKMGTGSFPGVEAAGAWG